MNESNTKKIINACPSLFSTLDDENSIVAISWFGFECGDGWCDLLVELCQKIQLRLNDMSEEDVAKICVHQVKEKYGSLRFYVSHHDDVIENHINDAMKQSLVTCEKCGSSGKLRGKHWYYVSCDRHSLEEYL